mgnify:CR=1 FL=1
MKSKRTENDYEIHFETAACAPYAGFVDHGMGAHAGKASAVVCVIASALFLLSGVFYFVDGNVQNGCICLGIAFLLSPYGLHYLAVKLTARFIGMRMLLKERIYG